MSGAEISKLTSVGSGTLYPLLMRLEKVGWLESNWEEERPEVLQRPRRRLYRLTTTGAAAARDSLREIYAEDASKSIAHGPTAPTWVRC